MSREPIGPADYKMASGWSLRAFPFTPSGRGPNAFELSVGNRDSRPAERPAVQVDWAQSFFKQGDEPPSPFVLLPNDGYGEGFTAVEPVTLAELRPLVSQTVVFPLVLVEKRDFGGTPRYSAGPMQEGRVMAHLTVLVDGRPMQMDFTYQLTWKQSLETLFNFNKK